MRTLRDSYRWLVAAALAGCALAAQAVPITGSISMLGGFTPVDSNWNSTVITDSSGNVISSGLNVATGLDFDPYGTNITGPNLTVNTATGDFSTLSPFPNTSGTIKDIQFSPLASRGGVGTVSDFWSVGGFSFALSSLTVLGQNDTFIVLSGTGVVTGAGFSATSGSWTLTGQTTGGAGIFSWSSVGAASGVAVAEPGALALLGIGLVAIGAVRIRTSARANKG